eukprot:g927.t1
MLCLYPFIRQLRYQAKQRTFYRFQTLHEIEIEESLELITTLVVILSAIMYMTLSQNYVVVLIWTICAIFNHSCSNTIVPD